MFFQQTTSAHKCTIIDSVELPDGTVSQEYDIIEVIHTNYQKTLFSIDENGIDTIPSDQEVDRIIGAANEKLTASQASSLDKTITDEECTAVISFLPLYKSAAYDKLN